MRSRDREHRGARGHRGSVLHPGRLRPVAAHEQQAGRHASPRRAERERSTQRATLAEAADQRLLARQLQFGARALEQLLHARQRGEERIGLRALRPDAVPAEAFLGHERSARHDERELAARIEQRAIRGHAALVLRVAVQEEEQAPRARPAPHDPIDRRLHVGRILPRQALTARDPRCAASPLTAWGLALRGPAARCRLRASPRGRRPMSATADQTPYTIITADTHAGANIQTYREYLDEKHRKLFDEWRG